MATVHKFLINIEDFYAELQAKDNDAEIERYKRFKAIKLLQKMVRGYLIRKWVAWLSYNARIIQCAYRCHLARIAYRNALKRAVIMKLYKRYNRAATMMASLWRGYFSRRTKFCYKTYRRWLRTVTERGERRAAEAAEFRAKSRADDLRILEEEARQWLAFVVFKLHHLLRTYVQVGTYSDLASNELSEFEKLIKSIKYTEYMKRLHKKYDEFVRKHKPQFSNKRLFPIIGDGHDYWYLTLPEMYEMTLPPPKPKMKTVFLDTHHGPIHSKPFLWKNPKHNMDFDEKGRGPYTPRVSKSKYPRAPAPTPNPGGDATLPTDPRFNLYVKHYKPAPDLLEYVDYHINVFLKRSNSIGESICEFPPSGTTEELRNTVGKEPRL